MYKVLVLEDEIKTVKTITQGLSENGYSVDFALDGQEGLILMNTHHYDLIITDILMPNLNGIEFCHKIRRMNSTIPILILSALGLTDDKLRGFESGGDDYLVKPFDFKELLARIKALLKRSNETKSPQRILEYADLRLNIDTKEVFKNDQPVQLTAKEFSLLEFFMMNTEILLSKEQIIEHVWGFDFDTGTNILEVYISYLRNKIGKDMSDRLIHTRKGLGYIFKDIH